MATYPTTQIKTKSGKTVIIRGAELKDIKLMSKFLDQIGKDSSFTLIYEGQIFDKRLMKKNWKNIIKSSTSLLIGAYAEDQIVGQLFFRVPTPEHPWTKHIGKFGMMVTKDYWGEGIGSKLMDIMIEFAKTIRLSKIEAMVRTDNDRALKLYERKGFVIEGTKQNSAFIHDEFKDEYFIAKIF